MTTQEKRKQIIIAGIEKRRKEKKRRRLRRKISAIIMIIVLFTISISAIYNAGAKEITLTEINEFEGTNETITLKTYSDSVKDVLEQTGYSVGEADKINKSINSEINDNDDIIIKRGKQITIKSDAGEQVVNITKSNTTDALVEAGYIPGEFDEVTTNGETLADSDTIEIVSVSTTEETTQIPIEFTTEYIEDSNLLKGETKVVSEGQAGLKSITDKILYKDGNEVSRQTINEEIIVPVKNKIIANGTKEPTVSTISSSPKKSKDTGNTINGMKYSKKITMTATAYSTSPSENGGYSVSAMGNPLGYGIVAIDPSIVPLGSKVYIESTDGSWTYGVASAEDTGGAIKGNRIDLCYSGSANEVNSFGRRSCNVYILQ